MEPLTTAAIALGSIIANKIAEKTAENAAQSLWNRLTKFLQSLKKESPETAVAIEKAPEQPIDYAQIVMKMQESAQKNPQIAEEMKALVKDAEAFKKIDPQYKEALDKVLKEIDEALQANSQTSQVINYGKIANFAQRDVNINEQTINL